MDYTAKLAAGKYDMDCVLRVCDLIFKKDGQVMKSHFSQADQMLAIMGRGKCTEGGEVRAQDRSTTGNLCVVQTMGRLYEKMQYGDRTRPLFTWSRASSCPGQGVHYCDIMNLLKKAAETCGRDTAKYGTDSLRRGGAAAYLLAGKSLSDVALFGRWADMNSCRLYVEPSIAHLMRGARDKVNMGVEEPRYILRHSDSKTKGDAVQSSCYESGKKGLICIGMRRWEMIGNGCGKGDRNSKQHK